LQTKDDGDRHSEDPQIQAEIRDVGEVGEGLEVDVFALGIIPKGLDGSARKAQHNLYHDDPCHDERGGGNNEVAELVFC
jgi:hypothetical protein